MGVRRTRIKTEYICLSELRPVHSSLPAQHQSRCWAFFMEIYNMTRDLEIIGHKRGYHHRNDSLEVTAHYNCIDSAERWCQENVGYGWANREYWFSFDHPQDAQAFRELWGDE